MDFADSAPSDRRFHWSRRNRGGCNILSGWNFTDMDASSSGDDVALNEKRKKNRRLLSRSFCQYILPWCTHNGAFPNIEKTLVMYFFKLIYRLRKSHSESATAKTVPWTFIQWRILNATSIRREMQKAENENTCVRVARNRVDSGNKRKR